MRHNPNKHDEMKTARKVYCTLENVSEQCARIESVEVACSNIICQILGEMIKLRNENKISCIYSKKIHVTIERSIAFDILRYVWELRCEFTVKVKV